MKTIATVIKTLLAVVILAALSLFAFVWSGRYPVAAGSGHSAPVAWLLKTTRERSVAVRSSDLIVPADLDSSERIAAGAAHYDAMCAGCHGKPGREPADSFDPPPPALYRQRVEPRKAFWTIKHGLKMTAMPSHLDHSDKENWDTVAFVQALPDMDAERYRRLTDEATHEHEDGEQERAAELDETQSGAGQASDESDTPWATPEEAIESFRQALVAGRGDAALAWLHPQATIIEGGQVQSVTEYENSGHLQSDMAFLGQVEAERLAREVKPGDGQATIETRQRLRGQIDGQSVDVISTETATLVETQDGWKIMHLAWSSQPFSAGEDREADENQNPQSHSEGDHDHDH